MPILHHRFGQTTIAKVSDSAELRQILVDPWFKSETIIIKPNWVSDEPADFTDSKSLRIILEALDSHVVVTESFREYMTGLGIPSSKISVIKNGVLPEQFTSAGLTATVEPG